MFANRSAHVTIQEITRLHVSLRILAKSLINSQKIPLQKEALLPLIMTD